MIRIDSFGDSAKFSDMLWGSDGFVNSLVLFSLLFIIILPEVLFAKDLADHKTYFLITVDTESLTRTKFNLPDQVFLKIHDKPSGIDAMMKIADQYNAKITFYFNVYEVFKYGEEKIKEIVKFIIKRGHDVQLHTDQPLTAGPERLLNMYTLEEQKEIIKKGKELLFQWTGKHPVAHRAGTYAANDDTVTALIENHIFLDSSSFYKNKNNRFHKNKFNINAVTQRGPFIEVPVTVFQVNEYAELAGFRLPATGRIKKLDLDSSNLEMLKTATSQLAQNHVDTIVLFMHSWSFVKEWGDEPDEREADVIDIGEFDEILRFAGNHPQIQMISTADYWDMWQDNSIALSGVDFVPQLSIDVGLITYLRRVMGIHRGNYLSWLAVSGILLILSVICVLVIYRKRHRHLQGNE